MSRRTKARRRASQRRNEQGRFCHKHEVVLTYDRDLKQWIARLDDDRGTPERAAQQGGIEIVDRRVGGGGQVIGRGAQAKGENTLDLMATLGMLSFPADKKNALARRLDAGLTLRSLWRRAGLEARMGNTLREKLSSGGGSDRVGEDSVAFQKVQRALARLPGPQQSRLVDLVCYDRAPPRHLIPDIIASLDELADHWRL